jgi:hypothetical protein
MIEQVIVDGDHTMNSNRMSFCHPHSPGTNFLEILHDMLDDGPLIPSSEEYPLNSVFQIL